MRAFPIEFQTEVWSHFRQFRENVLAVARMCKRFHSVVEQNVNQLIYIRVLSPASPGWSSCAGVRPVDQLHSH